MSARAARTLHVPRRSHCKPCFTPGTGAARRRRHLPSATKNLKSCKSLCADTPCGVDRRDDQPDFDDSCSLHRNDVRRGRGTLIRTSLVTATTLVVKESCQAVQPATAANSGQKVALVVGAAGDIGMAVARRLAAEHGFLVVPCCRTEEQAKDTCQGLGDACWRKTNPFISACDLGSVESVRQYATNLRSELNGTKLQACIHAAGVVSMPTSARQDDWRAGDVEPNMMINAVAPYVLTTHLRDALNLDTRIVTLTSTAALDVPNNFATPEYDIGFRKRTPNNPRLAYCESKAANVLFSDALSVRGVLSNACHPGSVATLALKYENRKRYEQRASMTSEERDAQARRLGLRTPDEGATTPVWLAASQDASNLRGGFFVDPKVEVRDLYGEGVPMWRTAESAEVVWRFLDSVASSA